MQTETSLTVVQRQWLWEFVRGDANTGEFEAWLYHEDALETALGSNVYLTLIACNFGNKEETHNTKKLIRSILDEGEYCHCASVRNLDAIEMGGDWFFEKFFAKMTQVAKPETDQWWLYISRCNICTTNWLVAQEERIHDMFYVQRIADQAVFEAQNGKWPAQFQTYADVLDVGVRLGVRQAQFVDRVSGAVQITVEELLQTGAKISAQDVGKALGISAEHAQILISRVRKDGAGPMAGSFVVGED